MKVLLIFVGLGLPIFISAQHTNADSLFFAKMPVRKFAYTRGQNTLNVTLPFKEIKVWDARPDTTSIGFIAFKNIERPDKILFHEGLSAEFASFINDNYKLQAADTAGNLLVLIKKFRLTDYASVASLKNNNAKNWSSGLILSAEMFVARADRYHALYRVDTIILAGTDAQSIEALSKKAFNIIFKKAENRELSKMHVGKTAFSYADIRKHVDDFTNMPILEAKTLNKGVYQSFAEFKMNDPSIRDYEIKKGKLSDELLVTENNQSYPLQDYWGYCDGEHLYIQSANNLFQLFRTGNTFNTRAIKSLSRTYEKTAMTDAASMYMFGAGISSLIKNNYVAKPSAFQLDMETGEIY